MNKFKQNISGNKLIRGKWAQIQLTPNIITGEKINIGIAMLDENGIVHARVAKNLDRLNCLYDDIDSAEFENKISVFQTFMDGASVDILEELNMFENISFSDMKPTKGNSYEEVLDRLFKQMVPVGIPQKKERKKKFETIRTSELRAKVFAGIKKNLGEELSKQYIHANKWKINIPNEAATVSLDLPLRNQSKNRAGTIVSGWYSSDEKVKVSLYEAVLDIRTAKDYLYDEKLGLFILRPDEESGLSQKTIRKIDSAIDQQAELLVRKNVDVEIQTQTNALIDAAGNWIAA
ncbi:DUF3037 domain-containing protein [Hydrogenovibrio sp. 3SP14C1]|uniref:DUF3037 domain-containing protein n=1 Tax=Hydrogenovibrio sp. 3SP14C1 TaxID=3038774 RepID=UPI002416BA2D|nr:DUF3037 domain-containing protein [Hydrogenovibrio sp. 3SP14C1]MDG4811907.1 DUF3037 domain-containing protein [Hydrogenovibrio sp. 3SP14C1]